MLLMLSRVIMAMSGGLYIVLATNYAAQLAPPEKGECDGHGDHWIYSFTSTRCTDWNILAGYVDWHAIFSSLQ